MSLEKFVLQRKVHFFDLKDSISFLRFLATFKLMCDSNKILEGAAMCFLPYYVKDNLANALISRICAEN